MKKLWKKIVAIGATVATVAVTAVSVGATESAMQTAFTTGIGTIKDDAIAFCVSALPVALAIVAVFLAVKFGMKFFKSLSKGA